MKSRTLAIATAAIITAAAFILTAGLSLLNGSAIDESLIPTESALPDASETVDSAVPEADKPVEDAPVEDAPIEDAPVEDAPVEDAPVEDAPVEDTPVEDDNEENVEMDEVLDRDAFNGCITVDIYEQNTAHYVGQVIIDDDEAYARLHELFSEYAENRVQLFNPNVGGVSSEHWLPRGEYRIEVMAGSIFAYSYAGDIVIENNTVMESLQSGVTFTGGEKVIEFINSLIVDEIAAIKAGTNTMPNPKNAIVETEKLMQYWCGGYNEALGQDVPGCGRPTPRFPYKTGANEDGEFDIVLVDVYEHSTGKLVGRINLSSTANVITVNKAADAYFDGPIGYNDPDYVDPALCNLPNGDYRIEIFSFTANEYGGYSGGLFMAYTYNLGEGAVGDRFELVQIGMTFNNGECVTSVLDTLIESGMQAIAEGNGEIPEVAASALSRCEDYWATQGRYSERFPYIAE